MKKTVGDRKFTGKTHEKQLKNSDFKPLLKCQAILSHGTYCKDLEYPFWYCFYVIMSITCQIDSQQHELLVISA